MIPDEDVVVTGAWAWDDMTSGCVTSVVIALREALGDRCSVEISDSALREPDDEPDNGPEI